MRMILGVRLGSAGKRELYLSSIDFGPTQPALLYRF